ncbi:hypothetical protein M3484_01870 [Pseudomonas sp. GX19020]|nr:hypothetical protein [Pseudomonas sp. GX19020]MCL4065323.1 hypothetical protein [Pseudomonas sp. GX19020]
MDSIWIWIYVGIAYGCNDAGWGFWRSMAWPAALGRMIARATPHREGE